MLWALWGPSDARMGFRVLRQVGYGVWEPSNSSGCLTQGQIKRRHMGQVNQQYRCSLYRCNILSVSEE